MISRFISVLLLFAGSGLTSAQSPTPSDGIDTLVVCAPDLKQAAEPWLAYRRQQGHRIALLSGSRSRVEIKRVIQDLAKQADLKFVVLIGDAPANGINTSAQVETYHVDAQVIGRWGAESTFATDHPYSDINDDGSPDLAIGRISADSASDLSGIVAKILAYEQNHDVGTWRRRVNFIAGVGGFGILADKILESSAKKFITDGIPAEYRTSMTQASWRSAYSPDPRLFQAQTIERMNQGCLAWIYLGHGRQRELDFYRVPDGGLPILSAREMPKISVRAGSPIAVFLSCYAGAFHADPDCLAEELLTRPAGPVAVIGGSSVTMPYAMAVMGNAMLHELFHERRATIGEVVMHAKQELAKPTEDQPQNMIDRLAKVMSPNPELLDEERAEHVRLFHLIGDPLLRIQHPKSVTLEVAEYGTAGQAITIQGNSQLDGPCVIELVCRRDRLTFTPKFRPTFQFTNEWLSELQTTYSKANNSVWCSATQTIRGGQFTATLIVPSDATGPSHVRVFVQGERDFAMGSTDIYLRLPPANTGAIRADGETTGSQSSTP